MRHMSLAILAGAIMGCAQMSTTAGAQERTLSAGDLYQGLEATRVLLKDKALVLDVRNFKVTGGTGVITTDVIDLGGDALVTGAAEVSNLTRGVEGAIPPGASIACEVRTGTTFFQTPGTWTEWSGIGGPSAAVQPKGRYAQVRITLNAADEKSPPTVSALTLKWDVKPAAASAGKITVADDKVQRIVRSPVNFGYERQDQADLVWMRKMFGLDKVIAGKKTEMEQLLELMNWCTTRKNNRPGPRNKDGSYPWQIRTVLTEQDGGTIGGHCMSFCETMIAAAGSFGWQGRHFAIHGFRDTSHEVPEIWVNELQKWVFFDPSLDTYYADQKTGEPLNLLEMHNIYVNFVLKPGEVQRRGQDVNLVRVESLRGTHPIKCISRDYAYGEPKVWDWQYGHGYMTAGWLQLTPRNTWNSQQEPWCPDFENSPDGYCGFPLYIDEKTPIPVETTKLWYTRKRDLWWTLNQASFRLVRTGDAALAVECGNSQPFFKRYLARIDGGDWKPVDAQFAWPLKPGKNTLELTCEDEFGKKGLASTAVVEYKAP